MRPRLRRTVIVVGLASTALGALCVVVLELRLRSGHPTGTDIGSGILLLFSYFVLIPLGLLAVLAAAIDHRRNGRRKDRS